MELTPLGSGFGVEVHGAAVADIAENGTLCARLLAAFEEHSRLVFRDQRITDEI
jgi:alpha-ketoglutarate-dependent 2,4-dichlorophenoxyacetate dioxygenase